MTKNAAGKVVLLVDDEPDMLVLLRIFANDCQPEMEILTATSGPAAIDLLQQRRVDLILCDYRMPVMDGIELLGRSVSLAPNARRLLMTSYADAAVQTRAQAAARDVLVLEKPLDPNALRQIVTRALALIAPSAPHK